MLERNSADARAFYYFFKDCPRVLDLNGIENGGNGNDMKKWLDIEISNLFNNVQ